MMVTMTALKTLVVNSAFLQEIKDGNPELWQAVHELRQLCEATEDAGWIAKRLVRLLDEMRDSLAMQFALEESFGYIETKSLGPEPLAGKLAAQAKSQHCSLYLQLSDLAELAEEMQYRGVARERLPLLLAAARSFDEKLREHELLENDLIERSFDWPVMACAR